VALPCDDEARRLIGDTTPRRLGSSLASGGGFGISEAAAVAAITGDDSALPSPEASSSALPLGHLLGPVPGPSAWNGSGYSWEEVDASAWAKRRLAQLLAAGDDDRGRVSMPGEEMAAASLDVLGLGAWSSDGDGGGGNSSRGPGTATTTTGNKDGDDGAAQIEGWASVRTVRGVATPWFELSVALRFRATSTAEAASPANGIAPGQLDDAVTVAGVARFAGLCPDDASPKDTGGGDLRVEGEPASPAELLGVEASRCAVSLPVQLTSGSGGRAQRDPLVAALVTSPGGGLRPFVARALAKLARELRGQRQGRRAEAYRGALVEAE
jgi:hypothetical protein